jgi:Domain of unknown function (DUF4203)
LGNSTVYDYFFAYDGPEGCSSNPVSIFDVIIFFYKLIGLVGILAGIAMCFFGSKFIFLVLRGLIFITVNVVMWNILDYTNLTDSSSSLVKLIGFGLCGVILGFAAAYYLGVMAELYMFAILGGFGVGCLINSLLYETQLNRVLRIAVCVLSGLIAGYFCKEKNMFVKSVSTGIIGAFLIVYGLIMSAGDLLQISKSQQDILKFVGIPILGAIGSFVQIKFVAPKDEQY